MLGFVSLYPAYKTIKVWVRRLPQPTAPAVEPYRDMSMPNNTVKLVRSFIAVLSTDAGRSRPAKSRLQQLPDWRPTHIFSADRRTELSFVEAESSPKGKAFPMAGKLTLVLGDDAEWDETQGRSCMGGAACIEWDTTNNIVNVVSSIVGLPPIYICRMPGVVAVASELRLFRALTGLRITVNPQAVVELFTVGYPLEHRSLFTCITVMPGGHVFRINGTGLPDLTPCWEPPEPLPKTDYFSYVDSQAEAFRRTVSKYKLSDSLFSLTGGLDTRAILAVLLEAGVKLTACTITGGRTISLDARQARDLCKAYGMTHIVVPLDEQFLRNLPTYVMEASQLSGGLASLSQAHEVYFHRQLKGLGSRRLSGNLGNQLGRQGVEGISQRKGKLSVLAHPLRAAGSASWDEHWLSRASLRRGHTLLRLLLQCEYLYSSLGNYSIGHHFMTQQHPYASRQLIENSFRAMLNSGEQEQFSPSHARFRDLRHRIFGESHEKSFQRKVIASVGGVIAKYPINWGWRARGGVSLRGLAWGALAFADVASSHWHIRLNSRRKNLRALNVGGLHEIKPWREWFDNSLREFVNDCLRSRLVTESDLFDVATVVRLLDEHYHGVKPHYDTLLATLDLALAQQLFADSPCQASRAE